MMGYNEATRVRGAHLPAPKTASSRECAKPAAPRFDAYATLGYQITFNETSLAPASWKRAKTRIDIGDSTGMPLQSARHIQVEASRWASRASHSSSAAPSSVRARSLARVSRSNPRASRA